MNESYRRFSCTSIFKPAGWSKYFGFGDRFQEVSRDSGVSYQHGSAVGRIRSAQETKRSLIISKSILFMFPQSDYIFLCFDKGLCVITQSPRTIRKLQAKPSLNLPNGVSRRRSSRTMVGGLICGRDMI